VTAPAKREDETDQSETGTEETTSESEIESIEEKAKIAITRLWARYRPAILDRLSVLEASAVELLEGPIDGELRRKAEGEAHTLAGSLGTFGFADASRDAREIEVLLQSVHLDATQTVRLSELVVNLRTQMEKEQTKSSDVLTGEKPMVPSIQTSIPSGESPATRGLRGLSVDVVLVDDDEVLSGLLLHTLKTQGYRTEWIVDGQVAADKLKGPSPTVKARIIVLDVNLPSLDGISVLRELSRTGALKETKVIMLTVRSSEPEVLSTLQLGAFDHVAKPVSVPVLMQRIKRALGS
jgi:CheY-like chemotaxis protein/HPt (histidine-containing phosphotransfer) domain-containing protein